MVSGPFTFVVTEVMVEMSNWITDYGLDISPDKTDVIVFIKKQTA